MVVLVLVKKCQIGCGRGTIGDIGEGGSGGGGVTIAFVAVCISGAC